MLRSEDWRAECVRSFFDYEYTKTTEWEAEKEWRISSPTRKGETGLYSDDPFNVRELTAVYFGWKCTEEDRSMICALLAHGLDHVKTFEAYPDPKTRRYAFNEVPRAQ